MGTDVVVLLDGVRGATARAAVERYVVDRLEHLEARWSRFRPTSDVSVLNAAGAHPVVVAPETFELITRALDAWRVTDGAFDPTVLTALVGAGYDRDFDSVGLDGPALVERGAPAPGCADIELDAVVGAIRLPPGVAIDLGGIGKGRAADLLASELLANEAFADESTNESTNHSSGATGVLVDLGGDLRVAGEPPVQGSADERTWVIAIDDPLGTGATGRLSLAEGGVATSSRLRRHWTRGGVDVHHLIDPRTGTPAASGLASVTVVAGSACHAEVVAKAAFVLGPRGGADLVARLGLTGVMVHDDGRIDDLPGVAAFRA
ncbi:MAG: FAD:protein FMN transferase [Acidimicrobiia bacterium]